VLLNITSYGTYNPACGEHREQQGERRPPHGPPLHVDAMTGSEPPDQRRYRDAQEEGDSCRHNAGNDDRYGRSVAQLRHRENPGERTL
jgi:hypothetical protein